MGFASFRGATAAASLCGLLACLSAPDQGSAAVHRVPSQYPNIRAGVQAAANGDTVLVAAGTYSGPGNSSIDFDGKAITVCSEAGPALTTIAPAVDQGAFIFESGEPPTAIVKGFTLRDGYRAIWCNESSPTMIECVFYRNWSYDDSGGAFFGRNSSPTFIDCDFVENYADGGSGGAIMLIYGNLTLRDCTFTGNAAVGVGYAAGGGAVFYDGRGVDVAEISGCTFTGNLATASGWDPPGPGGFGGALWIHSAGLVSDCTFTGNSATTADPHSSEGYGGAVNGATAFRRCMFSDNSARLEGGAVMDYGGVFEHCTFSGNRASDGGAVTTYGSPRFTDCIFSDNQADRGGALMVFYTSSRPELNDCLLIRNSASLGGALAIGASAVLRNCTLHQNAASGPEGGGAGLWISTSQGTTVENTIITASTQGQAVTCLGAVTMRCADIFGNADGDYVGCLSGLEGVDGNIAADPQFCDATSGDFTLNASSPCAPANAPPGCGLIGAFDVGCGQLAIEEDGIAPATRPFISITPNPVRLGSQVTVGGMGRDAIVEIVSVGGRVIDAVGLGPGGAARWYPARDLPSGVYFARVRGEDVRATRFVLVR